MPISYISTHVQDALNRLTLKYSGKKNLAALLTALVKPHQAIEDALQQVPLARLIDNAQGSALDGLGAIVGASRNNNGDAVYRSLIRGSIGENNSDGTPSTLLAILGAIFQTDAIFAMDANSLGLACSSSGGRLQITYGLGDPGLDPSQILPALLAFLPSIPAGVHVSSVYTFSKASVFAMAGPQAWGAGFGDVNNPAVGGGLSNLIYSDQGSGGLTINNTNAGTPALPSAPAKVDPGTTQTTPVAGTGTTTGGTTTGGNTTTGGTTGTGTGTGTTTGSTTTGGTGTTTGGTTTPSVTYQAVYVNGMQNSWRQYSYESANFDSEPDTRVTNGVALVAGVQGSGLPQYKAFNFNNNNNVAIDSTTVLGFVFDCYAVGGPLVLRAQVDSGQNGSPLYYQDITVQAGWGTYTVQWTDAATNGQPGTFTSWELLNLGANTPGKVFVNNMQFITNPNPTAPTYTLVPIDTSPCATSPANLLIHIKGNQFYDANNNRWIGRGFNIPDTRMGGKNEEAYGGVPTAAVPQLNALIDWLVNQGADFFRMYLDQQSSSADMVNNANYLSSLKQVIDHIGSRGARVMIAFGIDWTANPSAPPTGQPTTRTLTHVSQIVTSTRNCSHVSYAFSNEPHGNSTDAQKQAALSAFNACIQVVRQIESRDSAAYPHLCVVQGVTNYARNPTWYDANPATDPTYPIANNTTVGYLAYDEHNYERASAWGAVPYNEGFPGTLTTRPFLLGECGVNAYFDAPSNVGYSNFQDPGNTMDDGGAYNGTYANGTRNDIPDFINACERNGVPYCWWIADTRSYPCLLTDNDPNGYGAGKPITWNRDGLVVMQAIRNAKGLTGTLNADGSVS